MAALRKVAVHFTRSPDESKMVGTLAEQNRRVFFEYDPDWIASGPELSPFTLPIGPGLKEHTDLEFGPLPGLFDESLPDGWGLLLMDRHFRQLGRDPAAISPLERLSYLGTSTMGALTYHPPAEQEIVDDAVFDLHQLANQAQAVYTGDSTEVLTQLLRAGGSPGGARPKVLVGFNPQTEALISGEDDLPEGYEHWIVKFAAKDEIPDAGPMEYAYWLMAQAAGLVLPRAHLFETAQGDLFFGTKRFDRKKGNRRFHVHTFGNLIHANFRIPSCDYADLFQVTLALTKNREQLLQSFRSMVFNVMAHNRDDHAKNFAFLFDDAGGTWTLSPAYDLTFAHGPGGEHSTSVNGEGKQPTPKQMQQLAHRFDVKKTESETIYEEVSAAVAQWKDFADQAKLSRTKRDEIAAYHSPRFNP